MIINLRSLLATVVVLSLTVPGPASADHRGGHRHHDRGDRHGYRMPYRGRHYDGRHYPGGRYYYRHDGDDDLLFGLLAGGILGYAINGAQHSAPYYDDRYPPPAQRDALPPETYGYRDGTCLQEREYQTTIVVGGRNVPAYGTACLQPDGSWRRGAPQAVNY